MPIRPQVDVRGLKQLARKAREADIAMSRELRAVNRSVAEKVADEARSEVPFLTGRAARSVKARASAQRSSVVGGGNTAPYYPWLDFGGSTGRGHQPGRAGSGSVKRPIVKGGRFILPAAYHNKDHVDAYVEALNVILERLELM